MFRADGSGLKKLADRGGYRGVIEFLDVFDFHGSYQLLERIDGGPKMDRGNRRRKLFFPPGMFESFELRPGSTDRLAMAGSRQNREIGDDLTVSRIERIIDRGQQFLKA